MPASSSGRFHSPTVAFALTLMALGAGLTAHAQSGIGGTWKTTYGTWIASQSGSTVRGNYDSDEGRLIGEFDGTTFAGVWVEKGSSYRCKNARDGSFYWGPITLRFNETLTEFKGEWSYCTGHTGGVWNGNRAGGAPAADSDAPAACDADTLRKVAEQKSRDLTRAHELLDVTKKNT